MSDAAKRSLNVQAYVDARTFASVALRLANKNLLAKLNTSEALRICIEIVHEVLRTDAARQSVEMPEFATIADAIHALRAAGFSTKQLTTDNADKMMLRALAAESNVFDNSDDEIERIMRQLGGTPGTD